MKKSFKNPQQLQELIDRYFLSLEPETMHDDDGNLIVDKNGVPVMTQRKPATVASMAYAIGLKSKDQLVDLRAQKRYDDVIARALLRTEAYIERMLFDKSASGGAKYLLQENFGHSTDIEIDRENGGVVLLSDVGED